MIIYLENRETQINMKILKRESIARTPEEQLYLSLSNEPIAKYLATYNHIYIPKERILSFTNEQLDEVLLEQLNVTGFRLNYRLYNLDQWKYLKLLHLRNLCIKRITQLLIYTFHPAMKSSKIRFGTNRSG
jgi:hypothetical protein